MKYLKCVRQLQPERETNFKLDVIYELIQEDGDDIITSTDTDLGEGKPWTYHTTKDEFQEWIKDWYLFEEVTYEDYILQEFLEGRIVIEFKDYKACEYWGEKLNKVCCKYNIINQWDFNSPITDGEKDEDKYYINLDENKVELDVKYGDLKNIILSAPEENKKENENMKKEFTKKDLKDGMIVRFRNPLIKESLHILLNGQFLNNNGYNHQTFDNSWKEDLYCSNCEDYDIMEVFNTKSESFKDIFKAENLELIWERDETEDLAEKEYKFELLTISPNGDSYLDDEDDEIFIKKEAMWDDDGDEYLAISLEEAKFMIESLTEIVNTIENN